jgi:hypothetical protein
MYQPRQDVLGVAFHFGDDGGSSSVINWSERTREEFMFTIGLGTDMDAAHEGEFDGFARRAVRRLVVTMSDGTIMRVRPKLAPQGQRDRHPYLRRLRFFVKILPADAPSPKRAVAFDRSGKRLACLRDRDRGAFGPC